MHVPHRPALLAAAPVALSACDQNNVAAPTEAGVCWHMVQMKDGKYRFNELARNQPNLESCAAQLEAMRLNFNRLGANQTQEVGAYQGQFIFIQPEGVFSARNLTTTRYLALAPVSPKRETVPRARAT